MHLRMLHEEASGSVSHLLADLEAGEAVVIDPRAADVPVLLALLSETLLFSGLANPGRAVSTVLEERRWHPWFGAARRDEFMTRVVALPHPPST